MALALLPSLCLQGGKFPYPEAASPRQTWELSMGKILWRWLILELDTCTGRLACWRWVAAEEKQEGMFALGNASPRSWHLPAPALAAWLPQPSQLLPSPLGGSSLVTPEPGAGNRAGTVVVCL